ncbi:MAG: hypothetical protein R3F17_15925, partial [Planctomycetota bacterium]
MRQYALSKSLKLRIRELLLPALQIQFSPNPSLPIEEPLENEQHYMNKNAQTVGLIGFGTVLAGMLAFWLNSNPNRDRPSDPSRTPSPKVQTNSPDAELVGSPTVSVDTREELPKSAESNEPGPDNIDKDVDPKLGRHLWTDAELGLDLSGPWEEIDMNDYMFTAKPLGPPLNLTSAQITARR